LSAQFAKDNLPAPGDDAALNPFVDRWQTRGFVAEGLDQFAEAFIDRFAAMHLGQAYGARPINQNLLLLWPHIGESALDDLRQDTTNCHEVSIMPPMSLRQVGLIDSNRLVKVQLALERPSIVSTVSLGLQQSGQRV
jgi:hypothetical protein